MSAIDDLKRTTCACDIDCLIAKDAILDLAARLDEVEKRITELELASPCPMLKSICEDWEYTGKLDGTERIKNPIGQPKFGPLLNDAKPSPEYCTCGETETWFDRSMTTDEQGNVIQDMCDRCVKCGKEKKYVPEPDDAEPSPDREEMVEAAGAWQDGPAPKDGSWILGIFHGLPYVVSYDSWEVGGETLPDGSGSPPDGHESGWCLAGDNLHVMVEDEPEKWARIIHPNRCMPALWDGPAEYSDVKPSPDKQEMVERYTELVYPTCLTGRKRIRQILSDLIDEVRGLRKEPQ